MIEAAEACRAPWLGAFQVFLRGRTPEGRPAIVKPIDGDGDLVEIDPNLQASPAFTLDPNAAQDLFDSLWNAGIRPSGTPVDAKGVIAAKDEHIHDLRRVAFDGKVNS